MCISFCRLQIQVWRSKGTKVHRMKIKVTWHVQLTPKAVSLIGLQIINFCSTPNVFFLLVYFPQGWPRPQIPLQSHLPEERISAEWSPEQAPLQHSLDKIWQGSEKWQAPPLEHHGPGPKKLVLSLTFLKPRYFSHLLFRYRSSLWPSQKPQSGKGNKTPRYLVCCGPVPATKDWVSFCPAVFEFGSSNTLWIHTALVMAAHPVF